LPFLACGLKVPVCQACRTAFAALLARALYTRHAKNAFVLAAHTAAHTFAGALPWKHVRFCGVETGGLLTAMTSHSNND